jgi:hypothetical protein
MNPRQVSRRVDVAHATIVASGLILLAVVLRGESISVRHPEGNLHARLVLRTLDGVTIADGDLTQVVRESVVTARLTFHFKDGSLHDETTVFSQRGEFRLISDRVEQKGPSFPRPLEMSIDAASGAVTVRHAGEDGTQQEETDRLNLPSDLANGLIVPLLKNVNPSAPPRSFSYVAATPKPRLVKLAVTSVGDASGPAGRQGQRSVHYVLRPEIGGLSGLLAPLVGKQPPNSHVWILDGDTPAFIKAEEPLYVGGPLWRIELVSPASPGS